MSYQWATWLEDVLRAAGVPVVIEGDWKHRGRPGGNFTPRGIMLHHDASPKGETSNGADVIINGRSDLPGPLAQLWLDYDGGWHIIAAGRANHAGTGQWGDVPEDQGNEYLIGIESDHTTNEQWTQAQGLSGIVGLIALCDHLGIRDNAAELHDWLMAHKEYAAGRKPDPDPLDMDELRAVILNPPELTGGPVKTTSKSCSTPRNLVRNEWRNLQIADKGDVIWAVGQGPASWFVLTAALTISGPPGASVQLRPYKIAAGDENDRTGSYSTRQVELDAAGLAKVDLAQQGSISDDDWLRVEAYTGVDGVTVQSIASQLAIW